MKKICSYFYGILLAFVSGILFSITSFAADNVPVKNIEMHNKNITPTFVKKISTTQQAVTYIHQKIECLTRNQCTKNDELIVSYSVGLIWGAAFPQGFIEYLFLQKSYSANVGKFAQLASELLAAYLGLQGVLFQPSFTIAGKVFKNAFLLAMDAAGVASTVYTSKDSLPIGILRALLSYIAMNIKCIWSESYCQPSLTKRIESSTPPFSPSERRSGLYFLLGYISGKLLTLRKTDIMRMQKETTEKMREWSIKQVQEYQNLQRQIEEQLDRLLE